MSGLVLARHVGQTINITDTEHHQDFELEVVNIDRLFRRASIRFLGRVHLLKIGQSCRLSHDGRVTLSHIDNRGALLTFNAPQTLHILRSELAKRDAA